MAKKQPAAPAPKPFKVRAIQLGYYDNVRRRVGNVFTIQSEQEFSERWMVRVPEHTPESVSGPNAAIRQAHDDILAGASRPGILTDPDDAAGVTDDGSNPLDA